MFIELLDLRDGRVLALNGWPMTLCGSDVRLMVTRGALHADGYSPSRDSRARMKMGSVKNPEFHSSHKMRRRDTQTCCWMAQQ